MKVLLVDNHTLFLQGLQSILRAGGIEVAGVAEDGEEAVTRAGQLKPDVVILNAGGDNRSNRVTIRRIMKKAPAARIIVFADSRENLRVAARCGAAGYLLSEIDGDGLLIKLREMRSGGGKYSGKVSQR